MATVLGDIWLESNGGKMMMRQRFACIAIQAPYSQTGEYLGVLVGRSSDFRVALGARLPIRVRTVDNLRSSSPVTAAVFCGGFSPPSRAPTKYVAVYLLWLLSHSERETKKPALSRERVLIGRFGTDALRHLRMRADLPVREEDQFQARRPVFWLPD